MARATAGSVLGGWEPAIAGLLLVLLQLQLQFLFFGARDMGRG